MKPEARKRTVRGVSLLSVAVIQIVSGAGMGYRKVDHQVGAVKGASFWMRATMSSWTASARRAPLTVNIHSRPA
jgi:hypothetical protein